MLSSPRYRRAAVVRRLMVTGPSAEKPNHRTREDRLKVLVLNASLKHGNELSNTEEVTNMVLDEMRKHGAVEAETIRLADKNIPVGLGYRESPDDEWPEIADK